jgi:beta-phosphoglucomutase-like phosphatase (HAD superfamily)
VCSTSNEAAVRTLVEVLMGPIRYAKFQFFCGDAVAAKKPAPDVYNLAAETMGLEKSDCVVIEDSAIGSQAAKAAGMACLVTTSTYTTGEDFSGADRIYAELGDDEGCVTLADLISLSSATAD